MPQNAFVFSHVTLKKEFDSLIDIFFTLNHYPFSIRSFLQNGYFRPTYLYHETTDTCPLCGYKALHSGCVVLQPQLWQLFLEIIEHPSIRLEWLYLPYYTSESMVENVLTLEFSKVFKDPNT